MIFKSDFYLSTLWPNCLFIQTRPHYIPHILRDNKGAALTMKDCVSLLHQHRKVLRNQQGINKESDQQAESVMALETIQS